MVQDQTRVWVLCRELSRFPKPWFRIGSGRPDAISWPQVCKSNRRSQNRKSVRGCGVRQNSSTWTLFFERIWTDSTDKVSSCREYTLLRQTDERYPRAFDGSHIRSGPSLTVKASKSRLTLHGEMVQNDEYFGAEASNNVTELSFDIEDSIYVDANTLGTGRLVALLDMELPASWNITTSVTLKEDVTHTHVNERKWEQILNVDEVLGSWSPIWKKMTRLLQRPRRSNSMRLFCERVRQRIGGG